MIVRCAPDVVALRDGNRILVVPENRGSAYWLCGPAAVAWDLLGNGYPLPAVIDSLAALLAKDAMRAGLELDCLLRQWRAWGMIEVSEERIDGEPGGERGLQPDVPVLFCGGLPGDDRG